MSRPSEKALTLAEDLLDYVHPGMPRGAAIQEMAQMIDEMNSALVEVVCAAVDEFEKSSHGPSSALLTHLRRVALDYKPYVIDSQAQHELFTAETNTGTLTAPVAGQMP
jgi:hypothetical protein